MGDRPRIRDVSKPGVGFRASGPVMGAMRKLEKDGDGWPIRTIEGSKGSVLFLPVVGAETPIGMV